jgi:hypothetical protein
MVVECPVGVVILIVPHDVEDTKGPGRQRSLRELEVGNLGLWESCAWGSAGRTNVTDCGGREEPLTK